MPEAYVSNSAAHYVTGSSNPSPVRTLSVADTDTHSVRSTTPVTPPLPHTEVDVFIVRMENEPDETPSSSSYVLPRVDHEDEAPPPSNPASAPASDYDESESKSVVSQEDVFSTWLIPALVLAKWKRRPLGSPPTLPAANNSRQEFTYPVIEPWYFRKPRGRLFRLASTTAGTSQVQNNSFYTWLVPALVLAKGKRRPLGLRKYQGFDNHEIRKPPARVVRGGQCGWPTPRSTSG